MARKTKLSEKNKISALLRGLRRHPLQLNGVFESDSELIRLGQKFFYPFRRMV